MQVLPAAFSGKACIRYAERYTGSEDSQERDKQKLDTHFSIAMTAVSIAEAASYSLVPAEQRDGFSTGHIKILHEQVTKIIFSNLTVDQSCRKRNAFITNAGASEG